MDFGCEVVDTNPNLKSEWVYKDTDASSFSKTEHNIVFCEITLLKLLTNEVGIDKSFG